jgi:hypothetical protein
LAGPNSSSQGHVGVKLDKKEKKQGVRETKLSSLNFDPFDIRFCRGNLSVKNWLL